jgi:type VI secretion system FHA domain protein
MPLRLKITSYHARRLKEGHSKEFGVDGGKIGRSLESDWVLQDGKRYVSSHHAAIDFRSGSYYIIDTSRNGVYVNDETTPIGKGNPQRLFDGDRLRIGEYEMVAEVVGDESVDSPLTEEKHVDPVDYKQFVESPDPTGSALVSEHEMTAVGIEDLLLEGASASALKKAALKAASGMKLESDTAAHQRAKKKANPKNGPQASKPPEPAQPKLVDVPENESPSVALFAFFRGAGLEPRDIGDEEAVMMLHRLGTLTRELMTGLTDALRYRGDIKNKLRVPTTVIQPVCNNPIKFSAGVEEALNTLISEPAAGYLDAVEATREAFQDIENHQEAMRAAMQVAVSDLLERFDPNELKSTFKQREKTSSFISSSSKRRIWKHYAEAYETLATRSAGQLPNSFMEELSKAYGEESVRIKAERRQNISVEVQELEMPEADVG